MAENKKFWTSFEQLANEKATQEMANKEFAEEIPTGEFLGNEETLESSSTSRRDFLKYVGFSTAAATVAACEGPVIKSIPYVVKPEEITPGIPNYYATTYNDGADFAAVLVKTREGRPIKIEPNTDSHFNGDTNARVQASVLSLYDSDRLKNPTKGGVEVKWSSVFTELKVALDKAENDGKEIVLFTTTVVSPSTLRIIKSFKNKYTNFKHVIHDAVSISEKLDYFEEATGVRALPRYHFQKANLVVSFNADFLNDFNGQNVNADYSAKRKPGKDMGRHIQLESNMTLTGSNADTRIRLKPSEIGNALVHLANAVSTSIQFPANPLSPELAEGIEKIATELRLPTNRGRSIVIVGGNNYHHERYAHAINFALDNTTDTVVVGDRVFLRQGNDKHVAEMLKSMNASKVGVLMMEGVNPSYTLPVSMNFDAAMQKVETTVSFTTKLDETSTNAMYQLPIHHNYERWGDAFPKTNTYSITQPLINPLFNSKQYEEILLELVGKPADYYSYLKAYYLRKSTELGIAASWNSVLHDGILQFPVTAEDLWEEELLFVNSHSTEDYIYNLVVSSQAIKKETSSARFEFAAYQKSGIGTGIQSNNPWLQELPDPITRICWDNYVTMSAADALALDIVNEVQDNGAINGSVVNITANGVTLEKVAVLVQPGQANGTIGLALGYGRTVAGKVADGVGFNAYSLLNGTRSVFDIQVEKVAGFHEFASVQLAHTMMGRKIVNTTTLETYLHSKSSEEWNETPLFHTHKGTLPTEEVTLWENLDHETGHMWNMSMDLNACTGCGACVVACHLENNVPVVGKDEIRRHRDMHWLRIDRYYSSDMTKGVAEDKEYGGVSGIKKMYEEMEVASASPEVYYQPVMCQHCNHAPCETVCPVAATSHSKEGLNHMAYNRCIGTRYCANNCPYKVRRFNWFNYIANDDFSDVNPAQDDYGRMVLNPEVVVRSRGVMEKCSLCIQRIQYGKLEAKKEGRSLKDGDVQTACSQACPSNAFVFGDVNNKDSEITKVKQDPRAYHLLEEIGIQPSVFYQTKIKNA